MVVLKKKLLFFIIFSFLLFSNISKSSQIFDYETEIFLNKLLLSINSVNNFDKDIKIHIIKDTNPNAFVITDKRLFISSGLIEQSPDYVSLLAVLAHEVGHLQYFHLEKRKDSIEKFSKINLISNLALITGSILADEPQILSGTIASQANINSFYLSYSREQEREADLYSIKTIEKLNLPTSSLKKLLQILEKNALNKGFDENYQKFSTHPIFRERYEIIENNSKNTLFNFDQETQDQFKFIKAKFMAHNKNFNIDTLKGDHKLYFESISFSKKGNLKESLKKINFLINKYPEYIFLLETKADILRSHGFVNESTKFYKRVLNKYSDNHYIKYRIFLDKNIKNLENLEKDNLFYSNVNLLIQFPNNKYILNKFMELANDLEKDYWEKFLNIIVESKNNQDQSFKEKLFGISEKTNDKKLKKIIYQYLKL